MSLSNENNPRLVRISLGDISAGAASTNPALTLPNGGQLKSAHLMNKSTLAGDDTNNVQVLVRKVGGAVLATHLNDVASGGLTANDGKAMTLGSEADRKLAVGEDLEYDISHNGSGAALDDAILVLELVG